MDKSDERKKLYKNFAHTIIWRGLKGLYSKKKSM